MWSPVTAMLALVKLHLPLRTYQIRFLDSGEADTWRYQDGLWVTNEAHDFAMGTSKRPYAKGVFKRISDSMSGGHSTGKRRPVSSSATLPSRRRRVFEMNRHYSALQVLRSQLRFSD